MHIYMHLYIHDIYMFRYIRIVYVVSQIGANLNKYFPFFFPLTFHFPSPI